MRVVFVDSGFWIALLDSADQLHARAVALSSALQGVRLVTTQMVLVEVTDHVSGEGAQLRNLVVDMIRDLQSRSDVEIVAQTDAQFNAALQRYANRPDQRWSLTDCASFLIMEERGITEALAYDRDFEQAGFTALLRADAT